MYQIFRNDYFRNFLKKFYYTYINWEQAYLGEFISPNKTVLSGIFKGLKYPAYKSSGSGLLTKIIGTYEDELHPILERLSLNKYSHIVDIGCAEGYYAVGLAMMFPDAKVYAYDIDVIALTRCKEMAVINDVSERVVVNAKCEKSDLMNFSGNSLIICDCEGGEAELFDRVVASALTKSDLIIELHTREVPDVKSIIELAFRNTHEVHFISSLLKSAKNYPIMGKFPIEYQQDRFLLERDYQMEWACIVQR